MPKNNINTLLSHLKKIAQQVDIAQYAIYIDSDKDTGKKEILLYIKHKKIQQDYHTIKIDNEELQDACKQFCVDNQNNQIVLNQYQLKDLSEIYSKNKAIIQKHLINQIYNVFQTLKKEFNQFNKLGGQRNMFLKDDIKDCITRIQSNIDKKYYIVLDYDSTCHLKINVEETKNSLAFLRDIDDETMHKTDELNAHINQLEKINKLIQEDISQEDILQEATSQENIFFIFDNPTDNQFIDIAYNILYSRLLLKNLIDHDDYNSSNPIQIKLKLLWQHEYLRTLISKKFHDKPKNYQEKILDLTSHFANVLLRIDDIEPYSISIWPNKKTHQITIVANKKNRDNVSELIETEQDKIYQEMMIGTRNELFSNNWTIKLKFKEKYPEYKLSSYPWLENPTYYLYKAAVSIYNLGFIFNQQAWQDYQSNVDTQVDSLEKSIKNKIETAVLKYNILAYDEQELSDYDQYDQHNQKGYQSCYDESDAFYQFFLINNLLIL